MNNQTIFTELPTQLSNALDVWQGFNITHCSSNFGNDKIIFTLAAKRFDISFNFVGDMRNNLNGFSQIIATSFFFNHILINSAGGNVIGTMSFYIQKSFVVTKIEICFVSIHRNVTFSMFVWIQCSRIDINVRINFLVGNLKTS